MMSALHHDDASWIGMNFALLYIVGILTWEEDGDPLEKDLKEFDDLITGQIDSECRPSKSSIDKNRT